MNELPNTVGDQSEFWRRQRELVQGRIEPAEPVNPPRRFPWMIAIPTAALVLIVLATMGVLS